MNFLAFLAIAIHAGVNSELNKNPNKAPRRACIRALILESRHSSHINWMECICKHFCVRPFGVHWPPVTRSATVLLFAQSPCMYIAVKGDILKCSPTLGGILKRVVGFTSLFIPSLHIYLYQYILKEEAVTEKLILRLPIYLSISSNDYQDYIIRWYIFRYLWFGLLANADFSGLRDLVLILKELVEVKDLNSTHCDVFHSIVFVLCLYILIM